jgi:hypothetical protein
MRWALFCLVLLASLVAYYLTDPDARPVMAPLLAVVIVAAFFFIYLWTLDRLLPVFEIGAIFVLVTTIYSIFPLINYMAGGLQWTELSDLRLWSYNHYITPSDVGAFGWWYVLYIVGFAVTYLAVRRSAVARSRVARLPRLGERVVIVIFAAALMIFFFIMFKFFNLSYWNNYQDRLQGVGMGTELPYFVMQISHNLRGMLFVAKQCILLFLVMMWRKPWARVAAIGWIVMEAAILSIRMSGRGELVLLTLSTVLAYHRFVKPLTIRVAAFMVMFVLVAFIAFGVLRDFTGHGHEVVAVAGSTRIAALTVDNEFQALWATAYDLYMRKTYLDLHAPWQIFVSDLYMLIPSQFLPFYKWDPSEWYLEVIGLRGLGVGFMFGVAAQAVVGLGKWEMLLRGMLLGGIFGLLHRWYVRHQHSFWVVSFYLYCCAWTHYTFRATSFYTFYYDIYCWLPFFLAVTTTVWLLNRMGGSLRVDAPAAERRMA